MIEVRACPDCSKQLAATATSCSCGWTATPKVKRDSHYIERDHVCTWEAGGMRCRYPVGQFHGGESSGFCIFHRKLFNSTTAGADGAEIVRKSQNHTPKEYLVDAWEATYGRRTRALPDEDKKAYLARLVARNRGLLSEVEK